MLEVIPLGLIDDVKLERQVKLCVPDRMYQSLMSPSD